jgi:hypothetical protein
MRRNTTVLSDISVTAYGTCDECDREVECSTDVDTEDVLDANYPEAIIGYYGADAIVEALFDMEIKDKNGESVDIVRGVLQASADNLTSVKEDYQFRLHTKKERLNIKDEKMMEEITFAAEAMQKALRHYIRYRTLDNYCDGPVTE